MQNSEVTVNQRIFLARFEANESKDEEIEKELAANVDYVLRLLRDFGDHHVHCSSLSFLNSIFHKRKSVPLKDSRQLTTASFFNLAANFLNSSWASVRRAALQSILVIYPHMNEWTLKVYTYGKAMLSDLESDVRLIALDVVMLVVSDSRTTDMKLTCTLGTVVGLREDAFVAVCSMVMDPQPIIRAKASHCLGSFPAISNYLFEQMLSKKPLPSEASVSGQSTKRRKLAVSADVEGDYTMKSQAEFHSVEKSACGAVVHGLEDEFEEVRKNMLASMTAICLSHDNAYINKALEFFIDSLNDEIDDIRLYTIHCLTQIALKKPVSLNTDQITTVLMNLIDARRDFRVAARKFISCIQVETSADVVTIVRQVCSGLASYPEEEESIHELLRNLGGRLSTFIQIHVKEILGIREDKQHREPSLIDPYYYALIILTAAAKQTHPDLLKDLPLFLSSHTTFVQSMTSPSPFMVTYRPVSIADEFFEALNNPHITCDQVICIMNEIILHLDSKDHIRTLLEKYAKTRSLQVRLVRTFTKDPFNPSINEIAKRLLYETYSLESMSPERTTDVHEYLRQCRQTARFCFHQLTSAPNGFNPEKFNNQIPILNSKEFLLIGENKTAMPEIFVTPVNSQGNGNPDQKIRKQGSGKHAWSPILILPHISLKMEVDCVFRKQFTGIRIKCELKSRSDNTVTIWSTTVSPKVDSWYCEYDEYHCKSVICIPFGKNIADEMVARFTVVKPFNLDPIDAAIIDEDHETISKNFACTYFKRYVSSRTR